MRTIAQSRSRTTLALLVGTTLLAVAPFGVAIGAANAGGASPAVNENEGVCQPQSGHLEPPNATTKSLVYTAPEGYLISGYCVKAGSDQQGDGPHYVTLNPPVASVTITHPSGKDISHYTVTLVPKPTTSTPPTTTPTTAPPVTTTPSVTTTPTISASVPTPVTEVEGEQVKDKDKNKNKQPVEVLGEQAALPTQVAAGLAGDSSTVPPSSSQLWLAGMTGLLAAAIGLGLLSSRRTRRRA